MRVAVTGADGQLGYELCRQLGDQALPILERDVDITSATSVRSAFRDLRPEVVINTAAYTNVDGAEADPERCRDVNVEGTKHLVESSQEIGAKFLQVSTDYVFSGRHDQSRPFRETDAPDPRGVYARTKLASEQVVTSRLDDHLIVRTCGLYVNRDSDLVRNFAKTMLRLAAQRTTVSVVNDQHCTPSYVPHVTEAIMYLISSRQRGLFHIVNSGSTTWYGFAAELFRQAGISVHVTPIGTADYATAAERPVYSVLDTSKYAALDGPVMPPWQFGISEFLASGTSSFSR